jgi:hypothetical protein
MDTLKTVLWGIAYFLFALTLSLVSNAVYDVARREIWIFRNRKKRPAVVNRLLWKIAHF